MTHSKIKLMGAAATLALIAAPAATAWEGEMSVIVIDQVKLNQTLSDIQVHVPGETENVIASATSVGNAAAGLLKAGDLDYDAYQTNHGDTAATTTLDAHTVTDTAVASTTAYGNSSSAGTWMGNSYVQAHQVMNGTTTALSDIHVSSGHDVVSATTAAANVSVSASEYGDNMAYQTQTSNGSVYAETEAKLWYLTGTGQFQTTASGNVASSNGSSATSIQGAVQITAADNGIVSYSNIATDTSEQLIGAATASGNSYVLHNEWGYASLGRQGSELYQENSSGIVANSFVRPQEWNGPAAATAYGVGNTALISNVGSDTGLYANQYNFGGVSTHAQLNGNSVSGGTGMVNSTAIGNAASGLLCNVCGDAALQGGVTQYNAGNMYASGHINVGSAGTIIGAASAIGNTATFTSNGD